MNKPLEYVASGSSFFKLMYEESLRPENLEFFKKTFGALEGQHNHHISLLYNAHTEKRIGAIMNDNYRDLVYSIHADSGGLQMITRGETITEELKESVYENQSKHSDVAMCFDVIPVKVLSDRSERLDLNFRRFDHSTLEDCARATGKNLRRQIEYFVEQKSVARPMLIAQGNCYDTYMKWTECIMEEIPQDLHQYIGGIAMGAAALGKGTLEDIKRAFYFTQLPLDIGSNHLHLLGVGSVARLLPNLIFFQNGMYEDVEMSYDSTTHTSGPVLGSYYMNGRLNKITRLYDGQYRLVLDDIKKNFPFFDMDLKTFYECLNHSSRTYEEKFGNINPNIQTYYIFVASSILNFMEHVNTVRQSKKSILSMTKGIERSAFSALYDVKTADDFKSWKRNFAKYIDSKPVEVYTGDPITLDSLFE